MKFEYMMIVGIVLRMVKGCCEGNCEEQKVEFEYKRISEGNVGKEVEIGFHKVEYVYCVVVEVHVIPKWIDVYLKEDGMIRRVWFNDGNVKVVRFDKTKPFATKGMRFVVSNNDMLVIKEICVYTGKYQYAVVSYVSDGHVKCLYMNHNSNEIDSDDCKSLCLNVLPYDMLFIVDTNVNEIRNYDNTKVVPLRYDEGNCTIHDGSTIICVDSIDNNSLRMYNIHTVNVSHVHNSDNDTFVFRNYTAEIEQLQLYLTKFRYIYTTFPIIVGYYVSNIQRYKRKSQLLLNNINTIVVNNTIKGTKLYPISNCDELYHRKNGWYYFNINDITIQLYCDFTSTLNNPISIYIGSVNEQCIALHMTPLEIINNNNMINTITNDILINKAHHFPMKEHFDILVTTTTTTPHKGIIRTHKGEYILTEINSTNTSRIKYILCTTPQ